MTKTLTSIALISAMFSTTAVANNPLVTHMYTADLTTRVINGKMYVFPSSDVQCKEGFGSNDFCMPS
ncbi:hypothetical protein [Shewanella sp. 10N.286.48.B5]|uniref:hypothetical protein n=1 Tax=Shewanella sp. 10N.286.48.B5 TaxID=1880834 RepID=UPI000CAC27C3|nr:hypothetical protein [Shewanella sp. 10N.286.48.B5]PMH87372.1 hypothetical protein BCU57_07330 [Shewanella sp. 10N.286.48.B5]